MQKNEIELIKMDYRIEYKNHNSKAQKKHRGKFLDISIGHSFFVFDTKSKDNKREKKKAKNKCDYIKLISLCMAK